jgi:hypothetical protein
MIYLKSLTTTYLIDAHRNQTQDERGIIYNYPFTDLSDSIRIGLNPQRISFTPYITNLSTIPWRDIISISFDNVTWQKILFMDFSFNTIPGGGVYPFTVNMIISPLRLGMTHASGNIWGLNATPNLVNAGNHTAYAKLVYYAPRLYFPLVQNLIDFAGSSIALTNVSTKTYQGVSYPANTPIFNEGLYLSNEFADVAKLTFYNTTVHTIIAQIKSTRYPTDWVIGSGGITNLLTANQSNAETDTTGMDSSGGTFSRTTTAGEFYAGIAGFKLVSTGAGNIYICTDPISAGVTAGKYYAFSVYAKASTVAKNWYIRIVWFDAADGYLDVTATTSVAASISFTRLFVIGKAPATAAKYRVDVMLLATVAGDTLYIDNLMLEQINETTIKVWDDGSTNCLWIDIPNSLLVWKDYVNTFWVDFPTIQFLTENSAQVRQVVTIVVTHNGDIKGLHCKYEGGAFDDSTSDALDALVWTNEMTLGRFDGSLFNLIQYNYILIATEYGDLDFSLDALKFNDFYITNKTAGTIIYDEGKLTDEDGNDISGLTSGDLLEEGIITMTEGLSARWTAEIKDTYFL